MPFPRNWVEELIWEWLQLKGYVVLANLRLASGKRGGALEADVVGLRLVKTPVVEDNRSLIREVLEIVHVEAGCLTGSYKSNLNTIRKKFDPERVNAIRKRALEHIELESLYDRTLYGLSRHGVSGIEYRGLYVASYVARGQVDKLKDYLRVYGDELRNKLRGIDVELEFLTLREFFEKEVMSTINEWKERQVREKFSKTKRITLPENLWLLNLVDFMKSANLVKV
mgnify:CR=1 FL=1